MPRVNALANQLTGYSRKDDRRIQEGIDIYPGDQECRFGNLPHAKWHEQSGNGLIDLLLFCDDMKAVLEDTKKPWEADPAVGADIQLLQCIEENQCLADLDFDSTINQMGVAISQCMDILIGRRSIVPYLGSFLSCIINFDVVKGENDSHHTDQNPETLDSCLMKNKCLALEDDHLGVDVDKLVNCIGFDKLVSEISILLVALCRCASCLFFLTSRLCVPLYQQDHDGAPCSSLVENRYQLASCFRECGGSPLCLVDCLQGQGTVSVVLSYTVDCFRALLFDDELSRQVCLDEPSLAHETATDRHFLKFAKSLMRGLVACSQCRGPRKRFVQALSKTDQCTTECMVAANEREEMDDVIRRFWGMSSRDNVLFLFCALECYANEV
jgi:hypothetical protein